MYYGESGGDFQCPGSFCGIAKGKSFKSLKHR